VIQAEHALGDPTAATTIAGGVLNTTAISAATINMCTKRPRGEGQKAGKEVKVRPSLKLKNQPSHSSSPGSFLHTHTHTRPDIVLNAPRNELFAFFPVLFCTADSP